MIDWKLGILLVVCVVLMIWLGIEGFEQFVRSNQQLLSIKYGLGKVDSKNEFSKIGKTASDFRTASDYITASNWQGDNQGDNQNIYKELRSGKITEDDIRRMDRDPTSRQRGAAPRWLVYFDDTDYSPGSPDWKNSSSGSYLERRTGSRWNETAYKDELYYDKDAVGGRHLIRCAEDDFDCIRKLSYSDPDYAPMDFPGSWSQQFGGTSTNGTSFDEQLKRALQVLQQQAATQKMQTPSSPVAPASPASSSQRADANAGGANAGGANAGGNDLATCLADCLTKYNITSPTTAQLQACLALCSTGPATGA